MIEAPVRTTSPASVEETLRAEIARGDAVANAVQPILPFLLAQPDNSMVGDDILARVRGMMSHLADQLLDVLAGGSPAAGGQIRHHAQIETVTQALRQAPELLGHLHALALEWQLTERLQRGLAVDPVVPPLMQSALASPERAMRELAMELVNAQTRWHQSQRRMQLSLLELPPEQLDAAWGALRSSVTGEGRFAAAEAKIHSCYDEEAGRLALAKRLLASMGRSVGVALDVIQAGASLFVTALALGSGQTRDAVCLSTHRTQLTRLALTLRATGLGVDVIERQVLMLHPEAMLPRGLDRLSPDRATAILTNTRVEAL
ncbi:hypothetical protein ABVV53_12160 [Novosphingobium sp. RD2P27]|uniref:DUF2336 domain-containing protein n=1 Tax=Novosphingobium kalidii TaxID=3230299 RepID=A0ABV2D2U8_9SPHN